MISFSEQMKKLAKRKCFAHIESHSGMMTDTSMNVLNMKRSISV